MRSQQKAAAARAARPLRARDRAGGDPAEEGRRRSASTQDEFIRPDTTLEILGEAQARVPHRRQGLGDRRQLVGAQRRRGRAARRVRERRARARRSSRMARIVATRRRRRRAAHHGHRARCRRRDARSSAPGSRSTTMDVIELNEAFAAQSLGVPARARRRRRRSARQPERRRDRARPSARHERRAAAAHRGARAASARAGATRSCTMCIGVGQGMATIIERV